MFEENNFNDINITSMNKATQNANIKHERSEDLAKIAQDEYKNVLSWNEMDYQNCIKRARGNANSENNCNNTKRRLDKAALTNLQDALKEADENLSGIEEIVLQESKNKSHVSSVLLTVCKLSQKKCDNYDDLQFALAVIIFLVIVGTDYLQIAIVLAVNTRKNKVVKDDEKEVIEEKSVKKQDFTVSCTQPTNFQIAPQEIKTSNPITKEETKNLDEKPQEIKKVVDKKVVEKEPEKLISKHSGKFSFR